MELPFRIILIISLLIPFPLAAQHSPGIKWMQRETEEFILIYPQSMSEDAAVLALCLDELMRNNRESLPSPREHNKWPLVLTDKGLVSNGFVAMLPRSSVWFEAPAEDFTAVSDWQWLLAVHEGRHMAQFDASDHSTVRLFHILLGELGWIGGIGAGQPTWLLEGDAVTNETVLSEEGRGRDPLFLSRMLAFINDNPELSFNHAANPSYKKKRTESVLPGLCHGRLDTQGIRQGFHGRNLSENPSGTDSRSGYQTLEQKKPPEKKPQELYRDMASDWLNWAEIYYGADDADALNENSQTVNSRESFFLTDENRYYTQYEILGEVNGNIYARRTSINSLPRLVRINPDASGESRESELIPLPSDGRVSVSKRSDGQKGISVAWNSLRSHPVYLAHSTSDITIVDLDENDHPNRRRHPVKNSRALYPSLSPDGGMLALCIQEGNGRNALVITDSRTGNVIRRLKLENGTAAYPSWNQDAAQIVFSHRNNAGRVIGVWNIEEHYWTALTERTYETVKNPVFSASGKSVVFASNRSGKESLWSVKIEGSTENPVLLLEGGYGLRSPLILGNRVIASQITDSYGERIALRKTNPDMLPAETPDEKPPIYSPWLSDLLSSETRRIHETFSPLRNPENRPEAVSEGNENYPETGYKPAAHALNPHSWLLMGNPLTTALSLSVYSGDVLGTLSSEFGCIYDYSEISPGIIRTISLYRLPPDPGDFRGISLSPCLIGKSGVSSDNRGHVHFHADEPSPAAVYGPIISN